MLLLYRLIALLTAITIHEYSHGRVADILGDPTPRQTGRLTLNPLAHLDPIGSLMIVLVGFGWAKPVSINPNYFSHPKQDLVYVGLAGPAANFLTAYLFGLPLKLGLIANAGFLAPVLTVIVWINIALGIFNLVPIPPLDGSKVILPLISPKTQVFLERYGIFLLLLLLTVFGPIFIHGFFIPMVNFLVKLVL